MQFLVVMLFNNLSGKNTFECTVNYRFNVNKYKHHLTFFNLNSVLQSENIKCMTDLNQMKPIV